MSASPAIPPIFDTKPCSRCGGSGRYSFNMRDGDRCWGCSGHGVQIVRAQQDMAAEWHQAIQAQKRATVGDLKPGDDVAVDGKWLTVAAIAIDHTDVRGRTGRYVGEPGDMDAVEWTPCAWAAVVTYVDGTTRETATNEIVRRRSTGEAVLARVSEATRAFVAPRLEARRAAQAAQAAAE